MSFIRQKRAKKKGGGYYVYRYGQKSVWEQGKVKSIHLGRADAEAERAIERALRSAERQAREIEDWQRKTYGRTAQEAKEQEAKEREWSQEKFLADTTAPKEEGA